jgi:hypothetical protein
MADERNAGRNRRGRRRYFHPKKDKPEAPEAKAEPVRPPDNKNASGKVRKTRRRARSRQRTAEETRQPLEADVAYVRPQAVFVYTYSTHPEVRDAYEFRPEHFSSVGRHLDDYQIDLSKLLQDDTLGPDGTPIMAELTKKPDYNWEEWEE